ncbi:MAG: hypothetical protein R3D26_14860 [Cyanobacteriota/Melainabacteria group bacterium]
MMNLNQAVTPGEYNDVVDQMKQDESIKDLIANPGFIALMEEHKTLAQPLISLTGQRAAVVEEYRNEVNPAGRDPHALCQCPQSG